MDACSSTASCPSCTGGGVVVGGVNLTAYAANGHALLLGRSNDRGCDRRP